MTDKEYIVEKLVNIRVNNEGEKQVSVKWQGYRHPTWEPYSAIQNQLPELMAKLEQELLDLDRRSCWKRNRTNDRKVNLTLYLIMIMIK